MSSRYTAEGRRRSSMSHAKYSWTCVCGKTVWGNGGKSSHKRACREYKVNKLDALRGLIAEYGDGHEGGWTAEAVDLERQLSA